MEPSWPAPLLAGNPPLSGKDFVVAEWRDAGGPPSDQPRLIAPLHVHHIDDEAWYVLEGVLCVRVDQDTVEVRAGCGVLVPRGTAHTYWNPGPEPVRYLLIMTPNIHALIQAIHTLPDRSREPLAALFEKHNSTLLDG